MLKNKGKSGKNSVSATRIDIDAVPKDLMGKNFGVIYVFVEGDRKTQQRKAKIIIPEIQKLINTLKSKYKL